MPKHPGDAVLVPREKSKNEKNNGKKNGKKNEKNNNNGNVDRAGKKRKGSEMENENEIENGEKEIGNDIESNSNENNDDNEDKVEIKEEMEMEEVREMDYCGMLNRVLPESIRALGYCEVTPEFSARFSCAYRKYRYFFIQRDLNIKNMQIAASTLIGDHDFRNICKIDIAKVSNFRREVYSAEILPFQINVNNPELSVYMLEIRGIAFLWHMVRCIMSLLFMVGENLEKVSIITELLNIENMPAKPHYKMAPDLNLVLHECGFDNMKMIYTPSVIWSLTGHFEEIFGKFTIAAARAKNALETLKSWNFRKSDVNAFISYISEKKKNIDDRKSGWKHDKNVKNEKNDKDENKKSNNNNNDMEKSSSSSSSIHSGDNNIHNIDRKLEVGRNAEERLNVESSGDDILWSEVLLLLKNTHRLIPTDALLPHVPLIQVRAYMYSKNRVH